MRGITQTLTMDDAPRLGNCLSAAVATFLGRDLEEVPHFVELGAQLHADQCPDVVSPEWAAGGPLSADRVGWWAALLGYMSGAAGLWPVVLEHVDDAEPGEVVFVAGPSPRGVMHQVLYRDGAMVWDPHPSRDGILEVREVLAWRPATHDHG